MKSPLSQGVSHTLLRKLNITTALGLIVLTTGVASTALFASGTSNVAQTINAGTLSVDIVDGSYVTVGSPSVTMSAMPFSFSCQNAGGSSTGTFGTASEQIYIKNPDAADGGWSVTLAAAAPTAVWDWANADYDFNDPGTSGCTDDGATTDADSLAGQLTVDTSTVDTVADLTVGTCLACWETGISVWAGGSFVQGTTDSVTLLTGAAGSDDIGDWTVRDYTLTQTIPAEQPAASDYDINMVLTIV